MSGTSVPEAVAALETLVSGALLGWSVIDGVVWDIPANSDFAVVGSTGNPDEAGVEVTTSAVSASMAGNSEVYNVHCLLTAHKGTNDLPTLRTRAYDALESVTQALEGDRNLGGTVTVAQLVSHSLIQGVGETGTAVTIPFTIQVQAWSA